jgi:hypothetical protein
VHYCRSEEGSGKGEDGGEETTGREGSVRRRTARKGGRTHPPATRLEAPLLESDEVDEAEEEVEEPVVDAVPVVVALPDEDEPDAAEVEEEPTVVERVQSVVPSATTVAAPFPTFPAASVM